MHILLINTNPVIARLLALCTRDAEMKLEEVEDIHSVKRKYYDIVFVDEMSYENDVLNLDDYVSTPNKILFSNEDISIRAFDMTIKKPFLPSQIIEVLEAIEVRKEDEEHTNTENSFIPLVSLENDVDENLQVLDEEEIEKIKVLLDMGSEPETTVMLSEDEIEVRKMEIIKEQLISEGVEIVEEDKIVEELSAEDAFNIFSTSTPVKEKNIKKSKKKKRKNTLSKNLKYTEKELERIEDAIEMAIVTLKSKKMKKLLKGKKVNIDVQLEAKSR